MNREAVKIAQSILARETPGLVPDGWWGNFTNRAYMRAGPLVRSAVERVLELEGLSPGQLLQEAKELKSEAAKVGDDWLPEEQVDSITDRVAAEFQLEPSLLRKFVRLEAAQKVVGGARFFNAASVSPGAGLFKGLFQMGRPAWTDAQRSVPGLPSYEKWKDPDVNARAGAAYIKLNMKYARDKGYKGEFSPEVLYTMHNQGAAGFMRLLREGRTNANVENQSAEAKRVISSALAQNRVTLA